MRHTRKKGGAINNNNSNILGLGILNQYDREEANRKTANTQGLEIISMREGIAREFVFAYLKMKNLPLDKNIVSLTPEQLKELRNAFKDADIKNKSFEEIAEFFHCASIDEFDKQLQEWEMHNEPILIGNKTKLGHSYAKYLGRLMPHLTRSDKELEYIYDFDINNQCSNQGNNFSKTLSDNCIVIYKYLSNYTTQNEGYPDNYYIVLNLDLPTTGFALLKSDIFIRLSLIKNTFKEGLMSLIHPRLGFILQTQYPHIWAEKYWIADTRYDPMTRIVLLTLQKYAALRRYNGTNDESLCSVLYQENPFTPNTAYELKNPSINVPGHTFNEAEFLEELIDNQLWVMESPNTNRNNVPYKTMKDLDRLLPTPSGFKPPFFWQVYDSKNKDMPKTTLRHKNILYSIASKNSTYKNNAKIARNLGNTWSNIERIKHAPQYATQAQVNTYDRDYKYNIQPVLDRSNRRNKHIRVIQEYIRKTSNPIAKQKAVEELERLLKNRIVNQNKLPNRHKSTLQPMPPRLTELQRTAKKPNERLARFPPMQVRKTRKSRK